MIPMFKNLNDTSTMGELKKYKTFKYYNKRLGGVSIELLKEFLSKLPKDAETIGIYVVKRISKDAFSTKVGDLAPFHCAGICLAPRGNTNTSDIEEFVPDDCNNKSEEK